MHLYTVMPDYLDYLRKNHKNMLKNEISGIVIRLSHWIYFIPITDLSDRDFENGRLKRSTPAILRLYDGQTGIGKAMLANMFPVPYKAIIPLLLNNYDQNTQKLLQKRLDYIHKNQKRLEKAALRLYKQKVKGYAQSYLAVTLDFPVLEQECARWEETHFGKHYNRYPDEDYFIVNPYHEGFTSYYLMNKNRKVAKVIMNNATQNIVKIEEVLHEDYAPLEGFVHHHLNAQALTSWFRGRGIPSWRDGLDELLYNLHIKNGLELLNVAYGLSLSDQYWLNPVNAPLSWQDINFFDHDFHSHDYQEATFDGKIMLKQPDLFTPNNTSDGMLKKSWIVGEDHQRYLLKGSYKAKGFEPFCEVLSTFLSEALQLPYVPYTVTYLGDVVVSQCPCFIDENTELITAYALLKNAEIDLVHKSPEDLYADYREILNKHEVPRAFEYLTKMFILDYLMINCDRHLGNFGIIRDVNTLKWRSVAPIYDSGQAMGSQKQIYEMNFENAYGTFFTKQNRDFDEILHIVLKEHKSIDYAALYRASQRWIALLHAHQERAYIAEERIERCAQGLHLRIEKLKAYNENLR